MAGDNQPYRDIERRCTRFNDGIEDLFQKGHLASPGVFAAELNIVGKGFCEFYSRDGAPDHLFRAHFEFMLHMNGTGRDKGMDPFSLRIGE